MKDIRLIVREIINEEINGLKSIKINGYEYFYNKNNEKLYLDMDGKDEVNKKRMTSDEKNQLYNQINYNQPMIKF